MEFISNRVLLLSVMALPFLVAVTLREAGRSFMAYKLGDVTQKASGRMSLNPLVHAHPIYTGVLPAISFLSGMPFLLGFAKPVVVQSAFFRNLRRDLALMALAGPLTNLTLAFLSAGLMRLAVNYGLTANSWIVNTTAFGVLMNCMFLVLNILPVPPLDGGKLLEQFLPYHFAQGFRSVEPYAFLIILGIIILAPGIIVTPTYTLASVIIGVFGLSAF